MNKFCMLGKTDFERIANLIIMNTDNKNEFLFKIDKLHTTDMGVVRVRRNLSLDTDDIVAWCKAKIRNPNSSINRKGKNWYISIDHCVITVNAYSYTIITAHMLKQGI